MQITDGRYTRMAVKFESALQLGIILSVFSQLLFFVNGVGIAAMILMGKWGKAQRNTYLCRLGRSARSLIGAPGSLTPAAGVGGSSVTRLSKGAAGDLTSVVESM